MKKLSIALFLIALIAAGLYFAGQEEKSKLKPAVNPAELPESWHQPKLPPGCDDRDRPSFGCDGIRPR